MFSGGTLLKPRYGVSPTGWGMRVLPATGSAPSLSAHSLTHVPARSFPPPAHPATHPFCLVSGVAAAGGL